MAHPPINIIFDLDETLIHSRPTPDIKSIKDAIQGQYEMGEYAKGYTTIIRPIARELVRFAKDISDNKVFVATVSTEDYATPICRQFGINKINIFSRSDISYCNINKVSPLIARKGLCVLIDNLPRHENKVKINVFNVKKYIKCDEFEPFLFKRGDELNHLEYIKTQINDFLQK